MRMQVKLEIGHKAACRQEPTQEGFTHDWTIFVRGSEGKDISHFVEKVIFHLHESFPKPKRAVKEPPYKLDESGYGSFELKIEVCFKTKDEPRRVNFTYDLFLPLSGYPPVTSVRTEALTFTHPTEDFMKKLVKGGGVPIPAVNGVSNGLSNGHPPQAEMKEPVQKNKNTSENDKNKKTKVPKSTSKTSSAVVGMKRSMPSHEQADVDGTVKKKKKTSESSSSSKTKHLQNEVPPTSQPLKDLKVKFKPIPPKEVVEKKEASVDGNHKTKTSHSSKGKESKSHKEHSESKKSDTSEHKVKVKKKLDKVEKAEKKKSSEKKEKSKSKKDKKAVIEKVTIRRSSGDSWASAGSSSGLLTNVVAKNKALGKLLSEISDDEDEEVDLPTPFKQEPLTIVPKSTHKEQISNKNSNLKIKESSHVDCKNTNGNTHVEAANEEQPCQASESAEPMKISASENGLKDEKISEDKFSKKELYDLYEQITKCEDSEFLQKVVDVIEATGMYTVAEKTFEFDLCCLEKTTLQQLQKCLGIT